jgi:hypothetical protein
MLHDRALMPLLFTVQNTDKRVIVIVYRISVRQYVIHIVINVTTQASNYSHMCLLFKQPLAEQFNITSNAKTKRICR